MPADVTLSIDRRVSAEIRVEIATELRDFAPWGGTSGVAGVKRRRLYLVGTLTSALSPNFLPAGRIDEDWSIRGENLGERGL